MKTPPFLLIGCPLIALVGATVYFATFRALHQTPFHAALLEAEMPGPGAQFQEILVQLHLTDQQWEQVGQIRQTISDRDQRHQAIFHLLTPAQRAQFQQLRAEQEKEDAKVPTSAS
jgi:Spy/CpxP family protein refolding chaperone